MFGEYLGYLPPLLLERVIEAAQVSATGPIRYGWDGDGDGEVTDLVSPPESPAVYTNYGTNTIIFGVPGDDADLDTIGTAIP